MKERLYERVAHKSLLKLITSQVFSFIFLLEISLPYNTSNAALIKENIPGAKRYLYMTEASRL